MYTEIRSKKLKDGYESLYLDTIYLGRRTYSFLKLKVKIKPKTDEEKQHKEKCLETAKQAATKKDWELAKGDLEGLEKYNTSQDFVSFCKGYIQDHETLRDIKVFRAALQKLIKYYKKNEIPCYDLTPAFLDRFWKFLNVELNGETPHNYMKKLKMMIKAALKERHFKVNPTEELYLIKKKSAEKDVLTKSDIIKLSKAVCPNTNVKMASLFSCNTGLRFCDVIRLRWSNIKDDTLDIIQQKTGNRLIVNLNDDAIFFLRRRKQENDLIFPLPSHTGVLKSIRVWVKNAGITKKITYHCFRHTFGTNLIIAGVDVLTASKLLGHSDLKETMRYVRISEALKQEATQKLPSIFSKSNPNNEFTPTAK